MLLNYCLEENIKSLNVILSQVKKLFRNRWFRKIK